MQEVSINDSRGEKRDTAVLVAYRFLKFKFSIWRYDAVMVHAASSDALDSEFTRAVFPLKHANVEMISYLPEHGKATW